MWLMTWEAVQPRLPATNDANKNSLYVSIPWGRNAAKLFAEDIYDGERAESRAGRKKLIPMILRPNQVTNSLKTKCCAVATSSNPLRLSAWIHRRGEYVREREDGRFCRSAIWIGDCGNNAMSRRARNAFISVPNGHRFFWRPALFQNNDDELGLTELMPR
ncbi:MAG: hypothetical protein ACLSE6_05480 [Alphaproteobacteria bacterium]